MVNVSVLFLIFNRPEQTKSVFAKIRQAKPSRLFVAADGPREAHPEDYHRCEEVRKVVLDSIDWPCEIYTLLRDENLGCGRAPAEAITWFFSQVDEGIILEDDCLPDFTFFTFCKSLLDYYRNDENIMHISGTNLQDGRFVTHDSYYFSQYPHSWGWASWRRAWKHFNYHVTDSAEEIKSHLKHALKRPKEHSHWSKIYISTFSFPRNDIWDFQWSYSIWKNRGISILPGQTLVRNLGFDRDATHTQTPNKRYHLNELSAIEEIIHPKAVIINEDADFYTYKMYFKNRTSLPNRMRSMAYIIFPNWVYGPFKEVYRKIRF
jgi:hypothetical protein